MTIYNQFPQYAAAHDEPENEMPYAYGMSNQLPLPMNPSPANSMPPLFPSMMTPELYPQAPFSSSNLMQARYAEGGEVNAHEMMQEGPEGDLSALAQLIQQYGEGEDTILAHINRDEARELAEKYGHDINSMTGLPQFGFLKKVKKTFKKPKRILRYALPAAGAVLGAMVGGPAGAALGGSLGGAAGAAINKKDIFKGAVIGGTTAYAGANALPMIAPQTAASIGLPSAASSASSAGSLGATTAKTAAPTFKGFGSIPAMKGFGTTQGMTALGPVTGLKGFGAALPGGSAGLGGMFGSGAATTSGGLGTLGTIGATTGAGAALKGIASRLQKGRPQTTLEGIASAFSPESSEKSGIGSAIQGLASLFTNEGLLDKALLATAVGGTLLRREKTPKEPSLDELIARAPQWRPDQYPRNFRANPLKVIPFPGQYDPTIHGEHLFFSNPYPEVQYYNHGGAVDMDGGGFLDGDTDGHEDRIPAKLSDGEFVVDATTVAHLGNGNNRAGAKILQNMVDNVRRHKGVKGFPPKAKSISQYMQMRPRY